MPETITGHGAVFYDPSVEGTEFKLWEGAVERIATTAFDNALSRPDNVRGLYNHNPDHLLGTTEAGTMTLTRDRVGLSYSIPFDETDPDHVRVATKQARGDLVGSSFAFTIDAEEWRSEGGQDVRTITDLTLYDVGPVTYPAYTAADSGVRGVGERRYVDTTGKPLECRSACVQDARTSWDAWQVELRAQAEKDQEQRDVKLETLKRRARALDIR